MERPFFDIQSGREFFADEEGLRLPTIKPPKSKRCKSFSG
jgi:hypothetical protein